MNVDKEWIDKWIEKADHDLGTAKLTFKHIPEYFDTIAFHCQQATEKYLKALLSFYEIDFEKTHNLIYLLELVNQKFEISKLQFDEAILLNNFSVQIRYPNISLFLTKEQLETAITISENFRKFVMSIIEK